MLFAVATAPERRGVEAALNLLDTPPPAQIVQTGVGPLDVAEIAGRLAATQATGLVSVGTCGGLCPQALAGTLLLPATIVASDDGANRVIAIDADWHGRVYETLQAGFEVVTGAIATVDRVARTPEAKQHLHAETGALAVDMESAHLAAAAARADIPFVTLRVVLDEYDETLPKSVASGVDRAGNPTPFRLARTLALRPGDLPALLRLAARLRVANDALLRACRTAGPALLQP